MGQSSSFVESRNYPWASIFCSRVIQRYPTGQILLGFRERIAIILVPWKFLWIPWLFVYGLIPIQPGTLSNNIMANILKNPVLAEFFGYF